MDGWILKVVILLSILFPPVIPVTIFLLMKQEELQTIKDDRRVFPYLTNEQLVRLRTG